MAVSHGRLDPRAKSHSIIRLGNRFAIPFMWSTTLGLAAVALRDDPDMRVLLPKDVNAGLPAPAAATALLGRSGAAALLVVLFLAVTSATSAELIAVSSILTYDVYKVFLSWRWRARTVDAFPLRNTSTRQPPSHRFSRFLMPR